MAHSQSLSLNSSSTSLHTIPGVSSAAYSSSRSLFQIATPAQPRHCDRYPLFGFNPTIASGIVEAAFHTANRIWGWRSLWVGLEAQACQPRGQLSGRDRIGTRRHRSYGKLSVSLRFSVKSRFAKADMAADTQTISASRFATYHLGNAVQGIRFPDGDDRPCAIAWIQHWRGPHHICGQDLRGQQTQRRRDRAIR